MNSILRRCGALAAATVFCAMAGTALAQDFVLKYGHVGPVGDDSDDHISGVFLKDFLEGRSQGRIRVDIFPASQLGNFREMIEQVQLGTLELTHTTVGGMASFFPELQVTDIPYTITDDRLAEEMMTGPFFQEVSDAILAKTGTVRLVATSNTGRWRSFYTTGAEIRTAADMAGIKMRTINSPLQQEFVEFLGGNPTPVAWGELYTSLGTGVVEGTKNAALDIVSNKLNDHLRYAVLDEHAFLFGFYWMNDTWLQGLPAELQDLVIDGVRQMAVIQTQFNKRLDGAANARFMSEGEGGTIYVPTREEKATFLPARDHMTKWFTEQFGSEWVDKYTAAIKQAADKLAAERAALLGR